jgi:hypothetical protein
MDAENYRVNSTRVGWWTCSGVSQVSSPKRVQFVVLDSGVASHRAQPLQGACRPRLFMPQLQDNLDLKRINQIKAREEFEPLVPWRSGQQLMKRVLRQSLSVIVMLPL